MEFLSIFCVFLTIAAASSEASHRVHICGNLPYRNSQYWLNFIYDSADDSAIVFGLHSDWDEERRHIMRANLSGEENILFTAAGKLPDRFYRANTGDIQGNSYMELDKKIYKVNKNNPVSLEFLGKLLDNDGSTPKSFAVGDYFYTSVNLELQRYNKITGEQEFIPKTADSHRIEFHNSAIAAVGDTFYVIGGTQGSYANPDYKRTIYSFNNQEKKMNLLEVKLPRDTFYARAVAAGDLIYVFGGYETLGENATFYSDPLIFDTKTHEISVLDLGLNVFEEPNLLYVESKNRIYIFGDAAINSDKKHDIVCIDLPFDCTGKPNGLYPHENYCSKYIACSNDQKHEMNCPSGLHFNEAISSCDYPENANCEN